MPTTPDSLSSGTNTPSRDEVSSIVDHTLLKPESTHHDVAELIHEATELGTYSICVSPSMLPVTVPDELHVAAVCGLSLIHI